MSKISKIGSLEIESEAKKPPVMFSWFQLFGYIFLALLLVCAFLGLFGGGIFGRTNVRTDYFTVSYDSFARQQAINVMNIKILKPKDNHIRLSIDQSILKNTSIKNITPQPISQEYKGESIVYFFLTQSPVDSVEIAFMMEPETFGMIQGKIAVEDKYIELKQFIYP